MWDAGMLGCRSVATANSYPPIPSHRILGRRNGNSNSNRQQLTSAKLKGQSKAVVHVRMYIYMETVGI